MNIQNISSQNRLTCLDILRGLAIFGMILVAIQPEGMPLWMYHAQVPPAGYNPEIPGITWVDLIFPFFMFALGAAIPFALTKRLEAGVSKLKITGHIFWRSFLMGIFALYLGYWYPWAYGANPTEHKWIFWRTLGGFFFLVMFLGRIPGLSGRQEKSRKILSLIIKLSGLAGIISLLLTYTHFDSATNQWVNGFDGNGMDWVIYRLAQSYILASIVWMFTRKNYKIRLGLIAFLAVLRIHVDAGGNLGNFLKQYFSTEAWFEKLLGWIPLYHQAPWAYFTQSFKWLIDPAVYYDIAIIALIGTIFGDIMFHFTRNQKNKIEPDYISNSSWMGMLILYPLLVLLGLYAFFTRRVDLGFGLSLVLSVLLLASLHGIYRKDLKLLFIELTGYGIFFLLIGYLFDVAGHGIRKEPSNLSFYFATSGMAIFSLLFLYLLADIRGYSKAFSWFTDSGANPMMGYIAGRQCFFSILHLTGLAVLFETPIMHNIPLYFAYCALLTLLSVYFTAWLTRKKIILRV
jgi:predicted acyltransferase